MYHRCFEIISKTQKKFERRENKTPFNPWVKRVELVPPRRGARRAQGYGNVHVLIIPLIQHQVKNVEDAPHRVGFTSSRGTLHQRKRERLPAAGADASAGVCSQGVVVGGVHGGY